MRYCCNLGGGAVDVIQVTPGASTESFKSQDSVGSVLLLRTPWCSMVLQGTLHDPHTQRTPLTLHASRTPRTLHNPLTLCSPHCSTYSTVLHGTLCTPCDPCTTCTLQYSILLISIPHTPSYFGCSMGLRTFLSTLWYSAHSTYSVHSGILHGTPRYFVQSA